MRGVLGIDGKIYCMPGVANDVLIIDPIAGTDRFAIYLV